jgi:hypothetical protein
VSPAPQRIVLVLQSSPVAEAAFDPVLRIARRSAAHLEGVFVEDTRLLDLVALPSARFVHAHSHESATVDAGSIRRAIRVTASRARQEFTTRLTATTIPWSFTSRQCANLSEAFGEATEGDLVVVPLRRNGDNIGQVGDLIRAITQRVAVSLLVLNERGHPAASILAVYDGDRTDLTAALDLADNFDCRVDVLAAAPDDGTADALAVQARDHLASLHRKARVSALTYRTSSELEDAIRAAAPATLVIDRSGRTAKALDLAALLATSDISLYLRN